MFNNLIGGWSFTDSASSPSTSLATISGSNIIISVPQNQTTNYYSCSVKLPPALSPTGAKQVLDAERILEHSC